MNEFDEIVYYNGYIIDSLPFYDFVESLEILEPKPLDIDTQIDNIKRQLKYEKNPLAIKNLNREMNELMKEKKCLNGQKK